MTQRVELSLEQIQQLPKADLHVHLDGSITLSKLIELAQRKNIKLPSYTEEGLKEKVFKDTYADLPEYLEGFKYTCEVMKDDPEAIAEVAYEFAMDCNKDGLVYVEPRYSPELLIGDKIDFNQVVQAVDAGMQKAQKEINASKPDPQKPDFKYAHIICAMRMWDSQTTFETARKAVAARDTLGLPIMALDLAGPENGFPPMDHQEAYRLAHRSFMHKTVHAGEAYGPSSIFQALTHLYADRLGHGFHLFHENLIRTQEKEKAEKYITDLVQFIAARRVTIEVCLTSNLQTLPELENKVSNHSFAKMLENDLSLVLCTDNTTVSNTTLSKEIKLAIDNFAIDSHLLERIILYGVKRSFFPGDYKEKKDYLRACASYYAKVFESFKTAA